MSICSSSSSKAILFLRRAYSAVAAENGKAPQVAAASVMRKVAGDGGVVTKDVSWMKDPKTGNWLPETHFDQVDAVELREKFLSKKKSAAAAES